jgi:hypothetical protein
MRSRFEIAALFFFSAVYGCSTSSSTGGEVCTATQMVDGAGSATIAIGTSRTDCSFVLSNGARSVHFQCEDDLCNATDGPPNLEEWLCTSDQTANHTDCSTDATKDVADYLGLVETAGGGNYPCDFAFTCGTFTTTVTALLVEPTKHCAL